MSGEGTVYSWTIVTHPVLPLTAPWTPYNVALIQLAEGPRMISTIADMADNAFKSGMHVTIDWVKIDDTVTLPVFRAADDQP